MQVRGDGRRLAERRHEVVGQVVDLDRREPQSLDPGNRARLADEPRERVPRLPVAEAAEVDSGEDDLAMTLADAPPDLREDRRGAAAPRATADERDHAERARERAAVLDLHERARSLEARGGVDAADRAHVARHGRRALLARAGDDRARSARHPRRRPRDSRAAGDVDAPVRPRCTGDRLPRLRDRLVRHAARVDDRDVGRRRRPRRGRRRAAARGRPARPRTRPCSRGNEPRRTPWGQLA